MKILCGMNDTVPDCSELNYAFIELDKQTIDFIMKIVERSKTLPRSSEFCFMEFFEYSPVYLNALSPELEEYMFDVPIVLPEDIPIPKSDVRCEYSCIQIERDCFRWKTRQKHAVGDTETDTLYFANLEEIFVLTT